MEAAVEELAGRLRGVGGGLLLVVTGAGVSAPSGLATFRGPDPDAVWKRDLTEIATRAYFERDPVAWWQWFVARFGALAVAKPNAAHHALAALERWQVGRGGDFLLVTQNIDGLHEAAGSSRLVKVHGSVDRLRCTRAGCPNAAPRGSLPGEGFDLERLAADPRPEHLPRCPDCGALLRSHALLFDEMYHEHDDYGWLRVWAALRSMKELIFAGTSFSVGVTALALEMAWSGGIRPLSIDPTGPAPPGVRALRWPAEELLPAACAELGVETPSGDEIIGLRRDAG